MPRPYGLVLRGGENSTKGGRGLGDITVSSPSTLMSSLSSSGSLDYNSDLNDFGADTIAALNGSAGAPSLGPTGSDISSELSTLASGGYGTTSGSVSWLALAAIGFFIIVLVKK
jgi:hypothetical protein